MKDIINQIQKCWTQENDNIIKDSLWFIQNTMPKNACLNSRGYGFEHNYFFIVWNYHDYVIKTMFNGNGLYQYWFYVNSFFSFGDNYFFGDNLPLDIMVPFKEEKYCN